MTFLINSPSRLITSLIAFLFLLGIFSCNVTQEDGHTYITVGYDSAWAKFDKLEITWIDTVTGVKGTLFQGSPSDLKAKNKFLADDYKGQKIVVTFKGFKGAVLAYEERRSFDGADPDKITVVVVPVNPDVIIPPVDSPLIPGQKPKPPKLTAIKASPDSIVSINDSITFAATVTLDSGALKNYAWSYEEKDIYEDPTAITGKLAEIKGGHRYTKLGSFSMALKVKSETDSTALAHQNIQVVQDLPLANTGLDTTVYTKAMIKLHGEGRDKIGKIVKVEWKIGKGEFVAASSDTAFQAPATAQNIVIQFQVTDDDGQIAADTMIVHVIDQNEANLITLGISKGIVSPQFSPDTLFYTDTVPNEVASLTLKPEGNGIIKVNDVVVLSGQSSENIPLAVGKNGITVEVTSQSGDKKIYFVQVIRSKSENADLENLSLSAGNISPDFVASTVDYSLSVANAVTNSNITITLAQENATATIKVGSANPQALLSRKSIPIDLVVGANPITIVVTAQSGFIKTYTVQVTRGGNSTSNADLSSLSVKSGGGPLTLNTDFTPGTAFYTLTVPNAVDSIYLNAKVGIATSKLLVSGSATLGTISGQDIPIKLVTGANTLTVVVTAENGEKKTYTLIVTRDKNSNANLASFGPLADSLISPFSENTSTYTLVVKNEVSAITLKPKTAALTSTFGIVANAVIIDSANLSAPINLKVGGNTIDVKVRAEDGTTRAYTLSIYRNDLPVINGFNDTLISINDVIPFKINATDADGIKWYLWDFNGDGIIEDTAVTSTRSYAFPATAQILNIVVTVEDKVGERSRKAIVVTVIKDPPTVNAGKDTTVLTGQPIALKGEFTEKYGTVVQMEWSFGGGSYQKTKALDTTILAPSVETPIYPIVLRVIDDDGNVVSDTVIISVQKVVFEPVGIAGFTSGRVNCTSMALNGAGVPYMAFIDAANGSKATVMRYNSLSNGWEVVGSNGFSPGNADYTTLAISSKGVPYVAFKDYANSGKLTVMRLNATSTAWELVGAAGFTGSEVTVPFLALSGTDVPYVTFMDYGSGLKGTVMAYNSISNAWVTVGTPGFSVGRASALAMVINKFGVPYVAYSDEGNGNKGAVKKLNNSGNGWDLVGSMEFSMGGAFEISLALNSSGVPYVAFEDNARGNKATVMRLNATGTGWDVVGVPGFSGASVYFLSLAFDKAGLPSVAYQDWTISGRGMVMKLNSFGTAWEPVGTTGFAKGMVHWNSLVYNSSGVPYVGFHDEANGGKATVYKIISAP